MLKFIAALVASLCLLAAPVAQAQTISCVSGCSASASATVVGPDYVSGNWYSTLNAPWNLAGDAVGANKIALHPFYIVSTVSISQLGAYLTAGVASTNLQFAVYANSAATGRPTGNALGATGNISGATVGAVSGAISGGAITLTPGIYWFAVNDDNGSLAYAATRNEQGYMNAMVGSSSLAVATGASAGGGYSSFLQVSQTFGTWPSLTSASFTTQVSAGNWALGFLKVN